MVGQFFFIGSLNFCVHYIQTAISITAADLCVYICFSFMIRSTCINKSVCILTAYHLLNHIM